MHRPQCLKLCPLQGCHAAFQSLLLLLLLCRLDVDGVLPEPLPVATLAAAGSTTISGAAASVAAAACSFQPIQVVVCGLHLNGLLFPRSPLWWSCNTWAVAMRTCITSLRWRPQGWRLAVSTCWRWAQRFPSSAGCLLAKRRWRLWPAFLNDSGTGVVDGWCWYGGRVVFGWWAGGVGMVGG